MNNEFCYLNIRLLKVSIGEESNLIDVLGDNYEKEVKEFCAGYDGDIVVSSYDCNLNIKLQSESIITIDRLRKILLNVNSDEQLLALANYNDNYNSLNRITDLSWLEDLEESWIKSENSPEALGMCAFEQSEPSDNFLEKYFDYSSFGNYLKTSSIIYDDEKYEEMTDLELSQKYIEDFGFSSISRETKILHFDYSSFGEDLIAEGITWAEVYRPDETRLYGWFATI